MVMICWSLIDSACLFIRFGGEEKPLNINIFGDAERTHLKQAAAGP